MAANPIVGLAALTVGREPPANPGSTKTVPVESIVEPLKYAVGVRAVTEISTWPLIQLREISTDLTHVIVEIRVAIERGSTRANFSPGRTLAIVRMALLLSEVGAPVTAIVETEKIDDQAKR